MVMELLEDEKRAENLLGFSCSGSSWTRSETIHRRTCRGFFFSFLFRHPFGFFGKYSPDMLEHHTRLNLHLILLFLFFGFHFFSCWNSRYLCPIMELQESMP
jgi:hypothetical protein